jgi:hypothetical protein
MEGACTGSRLHGRYRSRANQADSYFEHGALICARVRLRMRVGVKADAPRS